MQVFRKDPALALIVILQSNEAEKRGADIGAVGPNRVCNPVVPDPRTGEAEEGVVAFWFDTTVFPNISRITACICRATRTHVTKATCRIHTQPTARQTYTST